MNRRVVPLVVERADVASELRGPERTCGLRAIASPPDAPILFHGSSENPSMTQVTARPAFFEESIRDQMEALPTELSKDFDGEIDLLRQNRDMRLLNPDRPYGHRR